MAQARLDVMVPIVAPKAAQNCDTNGENCDKVQAFIRIKVSFTIKFFHWVDKTFTLSILPGNNAQLSCNVRKVYEVEFPSFTGALGTNDAALQGPQMVKLIKFG